MSNSLSLYPSLVALSLADLQTSNKPIRRKEAATCLYCPTVLSRYNTDDICSACKKRVAVAAREKACATLDCKHWPDRNIVQRAIAGIKK